MRLNCEKIQFYIHFRNLWYLWELEICLMLNNLIIYLFIYLNHFTVCLHDIYLPEKRIIVYRYFKEFWAGKHFEVAQRKDLLFRIKLFGFPFFLLTYFKIH